MGLKSFIEVSADSHFPLENLPFGVFRPRSAGGDPPPPRPGVAIGDFVLDLSAVASAGLFGGPTLKNSQCFFQPSLNMFVEMGRPAWKEARSTIQKLLSADEPTLRDNASLRDKSLLPLSDVQMLLPTIIGDYTDFFCSMHHTKNCGTIFRGPENAIPQNCILQEFTVDSNVMVTSHPEVMRKLHTWRMNFNRILKRNASIAHELHISWNLGISSVFSRDDAPQFIICLLLELSSFIVDSSRRSAPLPPS